MIIRTKDDEIISIMKKKERKPTKPNTHTFKKIKKEKREIGTDPTFLCHCIEVGSSD